MSDEKAAVLGARRRGRATSDAGGVYLSTEHHTTSRAACQAQIGGVYAD